MSSYDPPEEEEREEGSSHDPGVQAQEVTENRRMPDAFYDLDRSDFVTLGVLFGIPTGLLAALLLWQFAPEIQDAAGDIVRNLFELLPT